MSKSKILEIPVTEFNFTNFINEISTNFKDCVEPEFICAYMRESNIEKDVYVELNALVPIWLAVPVLLQEPSSAGTPL